MAIDKETLKIRLAEAEGLSQTYDWCQRGFG